MKLSRNDLRKILHGFNSIANRLLKADMDDYGNILHKFIVFIDGEELISSYISSCGQCTIDVESDVKQVSSSYGKYIFTTGESDVEEVANIYAVLKYLDDNNCNVVRGITWGYSHSRSYQDKLDGFNDRFVMVLIRHIENYLTDIGVDMGLDENISFNITLTQGQINVATDNSVINATQTNSGVNIDELKKIINGIKEIALKELDEDEIESVNDSLEVVESEMVSQKPQKKVIKTGLNAIKAIKGSTEFVAAVAALIQFAQLFM